MAEPLWRWEALLAATGGAVAGDSPDGVSGISIDSRTLAPGDLFVAIKGDRLDGHAYVEAAFARGAVAALVARSALAQIPPQVGPLIVVDDTLAGLGAIARAARERSGARIIAVTGSVGKTGTKEALRHCFAAFGPTHAAEKSYNNHWGVPLTLARLGQSARFGIFEIGMNHAGEITPLSRMVRPHVALVTTVAPVHIGHFPSLDAIAEAKAEIFAGLAADGVAILNRDNAYFDLLAARAREAGAGRIIGFGSDDRAEARLLDAAFKEDGSQFEADILGTIVKARLAAPGRHLVENALGVLAAVAAEGCDVAAAAARLADLTPPEGRGAQSVIAAPGRARPGAAITLWAPPGGAR